MTEFILSFINTDSSWLNAFMVGLGYIIIALIVNFIILKSLSRLAKMTRSSLDDILIHTIHKPLNLSVILVGIDSAVSVADIPESLIDLFDKAIYTLIAIIWLVTLTRLANKIINRVIRSRADTTGLVKDVTPLLLNLLKIAITISMMMVILSIWDVDITILGLSAGISSAVILLAAKDSFANLFGGISVFIDKPYKIGDYIDLEGKERGEVVDIGLRSTRIKTRDDVQVAIPNSIIANSKVVNESQPTPNYRVRIPVSVAYGSDIELVERMLNVVALKNPKVIDVPEPRVRFRKFADSSLDFELLCWIDDPAQRGLTSHELNKAIYHKFNKIGIKFPFPQRDVHLYHEK